MLNTACCAFFCVRRSEASVFFLFLFLFSMHMNKTLPGTRERLRSFIERVRLALFLKRTRAARVVFALVVTLLLTATATYGSWALGLFDYDAELMGEEDDNSHLHLHGSADADGGGAHGGDGSAAGGGAGHTAGAGGDGGGGGGGGGAAASAVKRRPGRSPIFLGKSHQAMLFAARVHRGDDSIESEEAREAAELGDATEEEEEREGGGGGESEAGSEPGDQVGGKGGDGGEGEGRGGGEVGGGEALRGGEAGGRGGAGVGGGGSAGGGKESRRQKGCRAPKIRLSMRTALREVSEWRDAFGVDVVARYNWRSCAVVGNSGALLAGTSALLHSMLSPFFCYSVNPKPLTLNTLKHIHPLLFSCTHSAVFISHFIHSHTDILLYSPHACASVEAFHAPWRTRIQLMAQ